MPYTTISLSKQDHIASITLNRPDAGNAVTPMLIGELAEVCDSISSDNEIYVVLITGAGDVFCKDDENDENDDLETDDPLLEFPHRSGT